MNEADIPIDIHTLKLQEWLISRRIVPKNIQPQIKDIRNKISNAIKDMPANDELIKLLSGAHINYFHCKDIVEILKDTEKDTKSVFGSYGSQRMKDWQEIIKLYEKENVYLAETAQILVRNINYEIPGIKKQMAKFEQQSEESLKRIQDLGKTENILLGEHTTLCQKLGIKGEHLREELEEKLKSLPEIYSDSIKNVGSLSETVELYSEFSNNSTCLPILRHLIAAGNTTVYQYLHKEAPLTVEENPIQLNIESDIVPGTVDFGEIDFGVDDQGGDSSSSAEIIDFGEVQLETGDIDWGIETAPPSTGADIDFDVPIEEYGIVVEGVGMDGGIAKGDQAFTILDSPSYRDKVIDELYELEAFLKLRNYELNQLESASNIMFTLMDSISTYDAKSITKMLKNAEVVLGELLSERTRHLFQLKHSPKYANMLALKLKQKLSAVEKIKTTKEILKVRSVDFLKQKTDLKPVLNDTVEQTKIVQQSIEKDISKRYKNRVVNLMGGVGSM